MRSPTALTPTSILQRWRDGEKPTSAELQHLLDVELGDWQRAQAFEIDPESGLEKIATRSHLFQLVYPAIAQLCRGLAQGDRILLLLWTLWLPLAMQLAAERKNLGRTLVQGILGVQGSGKTTLAKVLSLILHRLNCSTLSISLDDLYKSYQERQQLRLQDPRLIWRGPPGTHDIDLGVELLDRLSSPNSPQPILVPRFDKSAWKGAGDRTTPERVDSADIVLFEGWFVGVRPIDNRAFETAPPPIITPEDRAFARDSNERLQAYLPLWQRLDRLMVLDPVDYRLSKQWRKEAEQQAIAMGKSGMGDEEIDRFVDYFWKALHPELFVKPLVEKAGWVNLGVEINRDRTLGQVYRPEAV